MLLYYETIVKNGKPVRRKAFKKLAPIGDEYPNKKSVEAEAWKVLEPINTNRIQPESAMPVKDFIEKFYLPWVKDNLRASTYKGYSKDCFDYVKDHLDGIRLRDFRTVHGQKLIAKIAKANPGLGHRTLMHIKYFLSGAFKHARREGLLDHENPMRDTSVPLRPKKFKGTVYTIEEVGWMGECLSGQAFVAVTIAALAGLRMSEIRGLRWRDFDGASLTISRAVWRTHIGETKTPESEASVPALPTLQRILLEHKTADSKPDDWILKGERKDMPLNLSNLARRVIQPGFADFNRKEIERVEREAQAEAEANPNVAVTCEAPRQLQWRGWPAFRRGLASNLYTLGVAPKIIQAILRHTDIGTTLAYYVRTQDDEARQALQKIEEWLKIV